MTVNYTGGWIIDISGAAAGYGTSFPAASGIQMNITHVNISIDNKIQASPKTGYKAGLQSAWDSSVVTSGGSPFRDRVPNEAYIALEAPKIRVNGFVQYVDDYQKLVEISADGHEKVFYHPIMAAGGDKGSGLYASRIADSGIDVQVASFTADSDARYDIQIGSNWIAYIMELKWIQAGSPAVY